MRIITRESTKRWGIPLHCDICEKAINDKGIVIDHRDNELILCKNCLKEAFNLLFFSNE